MDTAKFFRIENSTTWKSVIIDKSDVKNYLMFRVFKSRYTIIDETKPKNIKHLPQQKIIYVAVRDEETDNIFAATIQYLYRKASGALMFLVATEYDEPLEEKCPRKIIKQLSPTNNETAINWRRACLGLPPVNPDQMSLFE